MNAYCLKLISKERDGEVHMRASYIFSKNDVIANSGVILASILIYFTGSDVARSGHRRDHHRSGSARWHTEPRRSKA